MRFWRVMAYGCVIGLLNADYLDAESWQRTNGPTIAHVLALSVHPDRPQEYLIGTDNWVYRTTDAGATYQKVLRAREELTRHPRRPSLVFASQARSLDGGSTWARYSVGYSAYAFPPGDTTVVLALGSARPGDPGGVALYRSIDSGASFSARSVIHQSYLPQMGGSVSTDAADANLVYCTVHPSNELGSLYRSVDGGITWSLVSRPETRVVLVACDPANSGTVFVLAEGGLHVSDDRGQTWTEVLDVPGGWYETDAILFDSQYPGKMVLKTNGAIWRSEDGGTTWRSAPGPVGAGLSYLSASWSPKRTYIVISDSENGSSLLTTEDGGTSWLSLPVPLEPVALNVGGGKLAADPTDANRAYTGTCCGGAVFATDDGGSTWTRTEGRGGDGVVLNPADPSRLYVMGDGSGGLWTSDDYGNTWRETGYRRLYPNAPSMVSTIAFSSAQPRTIYLGAGSSVSGAADSASSATWARLFVSEDAGDTWDELPFAEYAGAIMGIAVAPGNPDSLLVVTNQVAAYRSVDGGMTWTRTAALGQAYGRNGLRRQMAVDPAAPSTVVVAGNDSLYVTRDLGLNWTVRRPPSYEGWAAPPALVHPVVGLTRLVIPSGVDGSLQISDDLGVSWTSYSTGIADRLGIVSPSAEGWYYANTDTSGVIRGRIGLPAVTSLWRRGTGTLTINGVGFGSTQGTGTVKFNRTSTAVSSWTDTAIVCQYPTATGAVSMTVTNDARYRVVVEDVLSRVTAAPTPAPGIITTVVTTHGATRGIAVDAAGALFIAEHSNHQIRRVDPNGTVTVFAGTGEAGDTGDGGPATQARLNGPHGIAVDRIGNIYFGDHFGHRVRRIGLDGIITTVAGTGVPGDGGSSGPASLAQLHYPGGVAVDSESNIYIADGGSGRVCRIDPSGILTTVAGPRTSDGLHLTTYNVAVDANGSLYISDIGNNRILRMGVDGALITIAGTGQAGSAGDGGPATEAQLNNPHGIALDTTGNLYIAEWQGYRVRRVSPDGIITTFAGVGERASSGDGGLATEARLSAYGLAVSARGEVYIDEGDGGHIRKVTPASVTTPIPSSPSLRLSAGSLAFPSTQTGATSQQTFTIANTGTANLVVNGITVTGANASQFSVAPSTFTIPAGGSAQTVTVTFAPTSTGTKSAALSITHNAAGSPSSVALTGTAVAVPAPDITVSPAIVDFGQVRVGVTSGATIALQNVGTMSLVVDSIKVMGSGFGVSPASATVVSGGRADLALTFLPTALGAATGELNLVTNDPDEHRVVVPLSGTGRLPHLTASADTLQFGHVLAGSSASQVLTIANNSASAINVTNVVPGDPLYRVSSRSFSLAAGGSRDVTVTFTPLAGQPSESTLTILTSDVEVPALTLVLSATSAVAGGPAAIVVLPASLTFGSVALGQSKSVSLLVSNEGGSSLRVLNVVASSGDVTVSKSSFTLAAGAEELLTVTLQPTIAGSLSETLELQSNDPLHPTVQVPLRATVTTGTGRPTLALDSPSLSFGQVAIGETSEFLLPVRNAGTATLTISNAVSDNVQVVASPTSLSVPPQESRSLTVRYRPMPGMPLSGRLTLYSNDTAQPQVGVAWSAVEVRSPYLSVSRVTPADGAFGVATTSEIQFVFSEPLYYRRGFTALDLAVTPEPLSGPAEDDLQVRSDGRTVVIPVTLARNTVYRLVVYGATGRSGLELFDMVEASFSTGTAPPVLAKVSGRVSEATGLAVSGSVYLMDSSHRLSAQTSVAMDGSFELAGVGEGSYTLYLDGAIADGRTATGSYDSNGDGVVDALTVRAGLDQTGLTMTATVRSGTTPVVASNLVAVDLDSSAGNQGQTSLGGVAGGKSVVLEVYATAAEGWTGAAVTVAFDSTKVSFAGASEGDHLLRRNGGTALFLSHVDPAASTVEYGGAILGATATTAVSGSGLLGRFRFTVLDGFSGETALRVILVKVHTLTGRTDVEPNLSATLRSSGGSSTPTTPTGPLSLDFNTADGDQGQTTGSGAAAGKAYQVQVHAVGAPTINGWSAKIEYDPVQVRYVSGSFQPSSLVAGLLSLVEEKSSYVSIGGAVLGGSGTGSGSGLLGTATFEVLSGFSGETELVIRQMSWKVVGSGEQMQTVDVRGTITAAVAGLAGDFNDDGAVNFSDFFLFADAFGGSDPAYDLNGDGAVNFSDFFVFADAFGSEARAKLIELAQQYLGLPVEAGIESAYPNPFNASTTVRYRLSEPGLVKLAVYGLTGQRVTTLVDEWQEAGSHQVTWDGRVENGVAAATGAYLIRMAGPDGVQVRKVTLLR